MVTFTEPFRANFRVEFLLGFPQGKLRREAVVATDSARSTPIATTALPFSLRLDAEGRMEMHLAAYQRPQSHVEAHAGTCHGKLTPPWR